MEKKFPILLASCIISGSLLAGCGSNGAEDNTGNQATNNSSMEENGASENEGMNEGTNEGMNDSGDSGSEETIDLEAGVDTALSNLEELKTTLENSNDDVKAINDQTMTLEENWDKMEAQVEQEFPDEYKNIEESLYPLIDEGKKDEPDTDKMTELIDETIMKLTEFKETLPAS